jgi:integrase
MPDRSLRAPKLRHYKPKNLAVVRINGRDHYLGPYGSPESQEKYFRLVAEWLAAGRTARQPKAADSSAEAAAPPLTVGELILAYWKHAEGYYRTRDGQPTQEVANIRDALRPLRKLYSRTPAKDFDTLALEAVRQSMVSSGLARTTINARVRRIRRAFRWAASRKLVPGSVASDLATLEALKRGRTAAPEPDPVKPVPLDVVEKTLPFMSRPVAAMVRLQLLTGCRAGEVMVMRGADLTVGEPNWEYSPAEHKNTWRNQGRVIVVGPKAQAIIREFLKPDLAAYLFDPRDVIAEHHARRAASRKTKRTPSERARRCKGKPGSKAAGRYDRRTYGQAIARGCDRAFPHPTLSQIKPSRLTPEQKQELKTWRALHRWSPLRLRHTAATAIRAAYGLEAAQAVLGHKKPDTVTIYAERDLARAHAVAAEVG